MSESILKEDRKAERGGASIRLMLFLLVLAVTINAGYNYIPTAYQGENFKQEMQTAVIQVTAMPSTTISPPDMLKAKLVKLATENQLPPSMIDVRQVNNVLTAHVRYSKDINIVPFGIYNYHYDFDHTVTPSGFLLKSN